MAIRLKGGSFDGQVQNIQPHDDKNGRWIEFVTTGEYYTSTREQDKDGNEIFVYRPGIKGPLTE